MTLSHTALEAALIESLKANASLPAAHRTTGGEIATAVVTAFQEAERMLTVTTSATSSDTPSTAR